MISVPRSDWRKGTAPPFHKTVWVKCPDCREELRLDTEHEVAPSGLVAPSIECPSCGFHDHVSLDGWRS